MFQQKTRKLEIYFVLFSVFCVVYHGLMLLYFNLILKNALGFVNQMTLWSLATNLSHLCITILDTLLFQQTSCTDTDIVISQSIEDVYLAPFTLAPGGRIQTIVTSPFALTFTRLWQLSEALFP